MYDRYLDKDILRGEQAARLLESEVFHAAVREILNNHAAEEEELVCSSGDVRDATARIREHAQMRRAILEVVSELNRIVTMAENQSYYNDELGE